MKRHTLERVIAPKLGASHSYNVDIAAGFDVTADLLALKGVNPFRTRAYRRAALVVRSLPEELGASVVRGFDPDTLPGIGADLALKIREFVTTGQCKALNALRREIPPGLRDLLSLPGIGPSRARALFQTLNVRDLRALQEAVNAHRVRKYWVLA